MLMGLRHPEVPTFPEFWAFPGGGVSPQDRKFSDDRIFLSGREEGASIVTLFRELAEETGFALDTGGEWMVVSDSIRKRLCTDNTAWAEAIDEGIFTIDEGLASLVTERTTPPLAPVRDTNRFYHIHFGRADIEPQQRRAADSRMERRVVPLLEPMRRSTTALGVRLEPRGKTFPLPRTTPLARLLQSPALSVAPSQHRCQPLVV